MSEEYDQSCSEEEEIDDYHPRGSEEKESDDYHSSCSEEEEIDDNHPRGSEKKESDDYHSSCSEEEVIDDNHPRGSEKKESDDYHSSGSEEEVINDLDFLRSYSKANEAKKCDPSSSGAKGSEGECNTVETKHKKGSLFETGLNRVIRRSRYKPEKKPEEENQRNIKPEKTGNELPTIVKISCIPQGFVEEDIEKYFKQFGEISRVVLAKSRKTGKSMHFAFIKFKHAVVAKIAAETMNNYVMFKRVLKASVVRDEIAQKWWETGEYTPNQCPGHTARMRNAANVNKTRPLSVENIRKNKRLWKLQRKMVQLREMGIDYSYWPQDTTNEKQREIVIKESRIFKEETKKGRRLKLRLEKGNHLRRVLHSVVKNMDLEEFKQLTPNELKKAMVTQIMKQLGMKEWAARKYVGKFMNERKKLKLEEKKQGRIMIENIEAQIRECAKKRRKILDYTSNKHKLIMDVDVSDLEIEFKTPPNVVKRKLRSSPKMS